MISSFTFKNFKSFENATLYIEEFTTLIGQNNAGKTNAFEGIQVLVGIISGQKISDVLEKYVRGGANHSSRIGTDSFKLGCSVFYTKDTTVDYEVTVNCLSEPVIESELITFIDQDSRKVIFKNVNQETGFDSSVIKTFRDKLLEDQNNSKDFEYVDLLLSNILGITFISPQINLIYKHSKISNATMETNCSNLAVVLKHMCEDPKKKKCLLHFIFNITENDIEDFEFISNQDGELSFNIKELYNKSVISLSLSEVSRGLIRYIAIIVTALNCKENSLLMIDDFDQGIYPSNVDRLIKSLNWISSRKKMDIVIATHNTGLLDRYYNSELNGVSVVYRLEGRGDRASKIVSLVHIDESLRLACRGSGLGYSLFNNDLMYYVKRDSTYSWLFED